MGDIAPNPLAHASESAHLLVAAVTSLAMPGTDMRLALDWSVVGMLEHRRLSDRVTDSPLVTSKTAGTATVGLVYRFR